MSSSGLKSYECFNIGSLEYIGVTIPGQAGKGRYLFGETGDANGERESRFCCKITKARGDVSISPRLFAC